MKKVNGFTIMEVTITMLVAGLLIGMAYAMYSVIYKSYGSFNRRNTEVTILTTLDGVLERDFDRADSVRKDTDGISLDSRGRHIAYKFEPNYIIRADGKADTFQLKAETITASFEQKPAAGLNKIDELAFTIIYQNAKIPFHFYKSYSSVDLFKQTNHAVN